MVEQRSGYFYQLLLFSKGNKIDFIPKKASDSGNSLTESRFFFFIPGTGGHLQFTLLLLAISRYAFYHCIPTVADGNYVPVGQPAF